MKTPPAMQALVEITKLEPKQGDTGYIDCPRCGGPSSFSWMRETISGKLYGGCEHCRLTLPRN